MDYTIKRSARKTLGIYVLKDGSVEVRCPFKTTNEQIDRFLTEKSEWIEEMSEKNRKSYEKKNSFTVNIGDKLLFLGREYLLDVSKNNKFGFDGEKFYVPDGIGSEEIKRCLVRIYKRLASDVIMSKVEYAAPKMGVEPTAVKINSANTRWGSCSGKNSLNFSWKLVMADEEAVNYVVVHELAHIIEHNHSRNFWKIVERVLPDYENNRRLLYNLQKRLENEDWD